MFALGFLCGVLCMLVGFLVLLAAAVNH